MQKIPAQPNQTSVLGAVIELDRTKDLFRGFERHTCKVIALAPTKLTGVRPMALEFKKTSPNSGGLQPAY